jgi:hypothetical protein
MSYEEEDTCIDAGSDARGTCHMRRRTHVEMLDLKLEEHVI